MATQQETEGAGIPENIRPAFIGGGVATLEPETEVDEWVEQDSQEMETTVSSPAAEEIRYGPWSVYIEGLIRKEVMGHTRSEAIQNYKNAIGIRRHDLVVDARRIDG